MTEPLSMLDEPRLRALIETTLDIITVLAADGTILYESPSVERVLGYTTQELIGCNAFDYIHADDRPAASTRFAQALAEPLSDLRSRLESEIPVEFRFRHKDGSWLYLESIGRKAGVGWPDNSVVINSRDASGRRKAEEALHRSDEKFKSAFEHSPLGIALVAPDGRWLEVNKRLCAIVGYSEAELLAMTFQKITYPKDLDKNLELVRQALAGDISFYEIEKRYIHKDGHIVWIMVNVSLVRDAGGEPAYFISQVQDISLRKEVQDALRASEAHHRAVLESALDAMVTIDRRGRITEWNPAAERIFGHSPTEALGGDIVELIFPVRVHQEYRAGIRRLAYEGAASILDRHHELPALRTDGTEGTIDLIVVRVEVEGEPHFTGFMRDITEWKAATHRLEESEQRYKSLFEYNADAVVSLDLSGRFLAANPVMEKITGYSQEELIAKSFVPLVVEKDQWSVLEQFQRTAGGEPQNIEFGLLHKDGHCVQMQTVGVPIIVDGDVVGVYALARDITEQRRTEERLRLLESVAVNARDAILITEAEPINSPGPRILYANESFTRMTGHTLEEVCGKTPRILQGEGTPRAELDKIRAALEKWQPVVAELLNYKKDGTPFWVEVSIAPVADEAGWYTHWVSLQRDITERKKADAELRAAKDEAERANEAKSEFLSRMSHELRTPLNGILGLAQVMQMDPLTDVDKEVVDDIYTAGKHLLSLINEVLDISRIEAGGLSISLEAVSVADVIFEALTVIAPIASAKNVRLIVDEQMLDTFFVLADRQRLLQVLMNLLANAVKYNRDGGSVWINCTDTGLGSSKIAVKDTGFGVPTEMVGRLFTPFDRLGAEKTEVEGTGLGLALTKRLVEAMGGAIEVESIPGEGSIFSVELPRADTTAEITSSDDALTLAGNANDKRLLTVLHVEDNTLNQKVVERSLARRGDTRLLVADNGRQGLDLAAQYRPDLILLDLHLPDMRGDEVLQRLRADETTRHIPVIIVSADATSAQVERLLAAGAEDYLTKPLDLRQFNRVLDKILLAEARLQEKAEL